MISAAASAPVRPERARTCEYFFNAAFTRTWARIPGTRINTKSNRYIPLIFIFYCRTSNWRYSSAAESNFKCLREPCQIARAIRLNNSNVLQTNAANTCVIQAWLDGDDLPGSQNFGGGTDTWPLVNLQAEPVACPMEESLHPSPNNAGPVAFADK